jgi:hypothetical protein
MTTTERAHPDEQRLAVLIQHPDPVAVDDWVDPDTLTHVADLFGTTFLQMLIEHGKLDDTITSGGLSDLMSYSFTRAFVLGAQFQAAGGHRDA